MSVGETRYEAAVGFGGFDATGPECEAAMDALQGHLLIADAERRVRFMSRAPLGGSVGQFIGRDFTGFVAAGQRPLVQDAVNAILAGGPGVELEAQGAESGRWYAMRIAGVRESGSVRGFVVHALDIDQAKRREIEALLLRSERGAPQAATGAGTPGVAEVQRRFDLMADALPVLISYVDKERRYQYNNAAYERWFGVSREELRGRDVESVLGRPAYERIRSYVDAALSRQPVSFELTVPYKNAGSRRVVAHYVPDVTERGEIAGFYALIEDVTRRREAEAALRERDDELRQLQKLESLGRLAGGMAHDFANLLQVVTTGCDAVLPALAEGSSEARQIERIKSAVQRGASMTRQLLSFSRKGEQQSVALDVDALVADMEIVLRRLLGARIDVETDLGCRSAICADPGQIQQILLNLAINARDAMPEGGRLCIATSCAELAAEEAARRGKIGAGPYVVVTVSDTGTGMDSATLARIFDPFFTTKPPEQGTGLGLSTVYGTVRRMGGHVEAESTLGAGTTLRLLLPSLGSPASSAAK